MFFLYYPEEFDGFDAPWKPKLRIPFMWNGEAKK